jgi:hypothetical protein
MGEKLPIDKYQTFCQSGIAQSMLFYTRLLPSSQKPKKKRGKWRITRLLDHKWQKKTAD